MLLRRDLSGSLGSIGIHMPMWLVVHRAAAILMATVAGAVGAVGPKNALNDTGAKVFGDGSRSGSRNEPAEYPGQDVRFGRDAAAAIGVLPKTGAGSGGFDFTKFSNVGSALPADAGLGASASDWACTYDNVTGLMWEVKVNDPTHLRHVAWTYTWFDSNSARNGGLEGTAGGGVCRDPGQCDTQRFVNAVNDAALCGYRDWRLPSRSELFSIVAHDRAYPTIDGIYFPNTQLVGTTTSYWASSPSAGNARAAWYVGFGVGSTYATEKTNALKVRAVRASRYP